MTDVDSGFKDLLRTVGQAVQKPTETGEEEYYERNPNLNGLRSAVEGVFFYCGILGENPSPRKLMVDGERVEKYVIAHANLRGSTEEGELVIQNNFLTLDGEVVQRNLESGAGFTRLNDSRIRELIDKIVD